MIFLPAGLDFEIGHSVSGDDVPIALGGENKILIILPGTLLFL